MTIVHWLAQTLTSFRKARFKWPCYQGGRGTTDDSNHGWFEKWRQYACAESEGTEEPEAPAPTWRRVTVQEPERPEAPPTCWPMGWRHEPGLHSEDSPESLIALAHGFHGCKLFFTSWSLKLSMSETFDGVPHCPQFSVSRDSWPLQKSQWHVWRSPCLPVPSSLPDLRWHVWSLSLAILVFPDHFKRGHYFRILVDSTFIAQFPFSGEQLLQSVTSLSCVSVLYPLRWNWLRNQIFPNIWTFINQVDFRIGYGGPF